MAFSYGMGTVSDYFNERGEGGTAFLITAFTLFAVSLAHLLVILSTKGGSLQVSGENRGIKSFVTSLKKLRDKTVFSLVALEVLWKSAYCISVAFYGVYQANDLAMTLRFITILTMAQALARIFASLVMGRIADKLGWHTALCICFSFAFISFVCIGTCNETNGAVMFLLYNVFFGIAMSGINGGLMNIVFDYLPGEECPSVLGLKSATSGLFGFGMTALAGVLLARIQKTGGAQIFSFTLKAQQILSFVSAILCILIILLLVVVIRNLERNR